MPIKAVKGQTQFVHGFIFFLCLSAMALSIDVVLPFLAVDAEGFGWILSMVALVLFAVNSVISLLLFLFSRPLAGTTHYECDTYFEVDGHKISYEDVLYMDATSFDTEYAGYRRYRNVEAYVYIRYIDRTENYGKQCGVIIQDISFFALHRLRKKCKKSRVHINNQWVYLIAFPLGFFMLPILLALLSPLIGE